MAGESFPASWFNPTGAVPMPNSAGTSRFVDYNNGSDATGDGSIGNPYKTIAKASDVCVAGDIVELRYHQGQIYLPPPGKRVSTGLTFAEKQGTTGDVTYIQFLAGGSLTVNVWGHYVQIIYVTGVTTRQQVQDAVNAAATWLTVTGGSATVVSADVAAVSLGGDPGYTHGANQTQTVNSNSIFVSGTNGATPPGTTTPITIRTYPPDRTTYGRAVVRARPGGIFCPGKNLAAGDQGKTAATILSQGTIAVITGGGVSYSNSGAVTLPGCSGTFWYTGKSTDTLTGVHNGGGAPSGTTTSGVVIPAPNTATDMNAINTQGQSALRFQGLKVDYSSGRRGVGMYVSGSSNYIDVLDCEFTANWYQNLNVDPTIAHVYVRRCWNHDVGTGAESFANDTSTNPDAQQHDIYCEGNDLWLICCVLGDCPYGYSAQHFPSGDSHFNVHCTMVHAGTGDPPRQAGNVVIDGVTNTKVYNSILADPYGFCINKGSGSATGALCSHSWLAINGADTTSHSYFGNQGARDSSWITDTTNTKTTGMPNFSNYSGRSTNPAGLAPSSDPGIAADTTFSPPYDFLGNTRTLYTVGAFEYVPGGGGGAGAFNKAVHRRRN